MSKAIARRIKMLECRACRAQTAADIIAMLRVRPPRNADEFSSWARNLDPAARAAYAAIVERELAAWRARRGGEQWES